MIVALAGGVGGAKLANGLAQILPPDRLLVVVNTGDDFEHLGLRISPDLDTVMYTLAGRSNLDHGWGLSGETWNFMAALETVGGETWFRLGDRDLATHIERTTRLRRGETLTDVTAYLCRRYGVSHGIVPMSDDDVRTFVHTRDGVLAFQDYFVRRRCEPVVTGIEFRGDLIAKPNPAFTRALDSVQIEAVVICPSNPFLSIEPILALPAVRSRLESMSVPRIAVSPIILGRAVKGPAAKMMRELGKEPSALAVAALYSGLVNGMIVDERDHEQIRCLSTADVTVASTDTMMNSVADQMRLARAVLQLAHNMSSSKGVAS